MAILTLLVIKTVIYGYHDHTGHWNRYGYRDHTGHENQHDYHDLPGHQNQRLYFQNWTRYWLQGTRSRIASGAPFMLVSSTQGPPRLSLVFCIAVFPWLGTLCHVVSLLKQVRWFRSLRVVLAILGVWTLAAGVETFWGHHLSYP